MVELKPSVGGRSPRLRLYGFSFVMLAVAALWSVGGCGVKGENDTPKQAEPSSEDAKDDQTVHSTQAPSEVPLFHDWPQAKPDLVLVLSGETLGYMRPCGCSEGQAGGLARRAGLADYLRKEKGWDPLFLDMGNLVKGGGLLAWDKDRYAHIVESLKSLGYKVLGVGPNDLTVPDDTVVGQALNSDPLTMVLGNVASDNEQFQAAAEVVLPPMKVVDVGGEKVGVGCVIGEEHAETLRNYRLTVQPPIEAARKILQQMQKESADFRVLFAYLSMDAAKELARAVPEFDLILCQSDGKAAIPDDAILEGKTMITFIGPKGMSMGVVGVWKTAEPRMKFDVVAIDTRFGESDTVNDIYADYVAGLEEADYLSKMRRHDAPGGVEFVGSDSCAACHPKAFEHWKNSKHAHALRTLLDPKLAKPEGQHANPECVACHVVGWRMDHNLGVPVAWKSGFITYDQTPSLGGVGCESCHGPGGKHVSNPANEEWRKTVRVSLSEQQCRQCHDLDNSLHFDFEKYWPKVAHPWKH